MTKILNHINTYADLTVYNNDMSKDFPNISYIQGSDEVKWEKTDPYINVCKYNVTSTSEATKLLNSNSGITYQIIDGVKQDTAQMNYTFDITGEHIVEYKFNGTSIGANAFNDCDRLTSVTIGSGVTSIGDYAFGYCTGLTNINIPNGVTSIGKEVFINCKGITNVTIGNSVTSIGNGAFSYCSDITSIIIPDSVTRIDNYAFDECSGLTSITIPSGVTSIGDSAFWGCKGLTSVTVEATTPPTLGSSVFNNTNNCPIYVPAESVDAYKAATNWNSLASRIQAISE